MSCNCGGGTTANQVLLIGENGVTVRGSGTATDPYRASGTGGSPLLQLQVRDSSTVNMSLFGSGSANDPYVLRADTSSAASLRSLGDVASSPTVQQGAVPMWIGPVNSGQFQFRTPGVRYTTNATRGSGLYTGELIRETDTSKRYEWDGSQWVDISPVTPAAAAAAYQPDASVLQSAGTLPATTDWNTLTAKSGIYRIQTWNSGLNAPDGAYNFGTLVVVISGNSVTQRYSAHSTGFEYVRTKWNASDWTVWQRGWTASEGAAVQQASATQGAGVQAYGQSVQSYGGVDITKVGLTVTFRFNLFINGSKPAGGDSNANILQLPGGFRPRSFSSDFFAHNGSSMWGMAVDTDGWLRFRTAGFGGGGIWGTVTFQAA